MLPPQGKFLTLPVTHGRLGPIMPSRPIADHVLPDGQTIELRQGDLTEETFDAIVNAANSQLAHGGGVAGAILRRGGPSIQTESKEWVARHSPVPVGEAAWTGPGQLPVKGVIHAVGPRWGEGDEPAKLRRAALSALDRAAEKACAGVAMPAISSGIFGFPKAACAEILIEAAVDYLTERPAGPVRCVRFTIIDEETVAVFREAFVRRFGPGVLRS